MSNSNDLPSGASLDIPAGVDGADPVFIDKDKTVENPADRKAALKAILFPEAPHSDMSADRKENLRSILFPKPPQMKGDVVVAKDYESLAQNDIHVQKDTTPVVKDLLEQQLERAQGSIRATPEPQITKADESIKPQPIKQTPIGETVTKKGDIGIPAGQHAKGIGMAFLNGVLPMGSKQDADLIKQYKWSEIVGEYAGVGAALLATAPLEGIYQARPLIEKIRALGPVGRYAARAIPKAIHFAVAGFVKSSYDNTAKLARQEISVEDAAKNIAQSTIAMGMFALPSSVSGPLLRASAEGVYGYSLAKWNKATNGEALLSGALQMGLGLIDRSNLSEREKQVEYNRIAAKVGNEITKKMGMRYENSMLYVESVAKRFGNYDALKGHITKLIEEGQLPEYSETVVEDMAHKYLDYMGSVVAKSKQSGYPAILMTPSEAFGARPKGSEFGTGPRIEIEGEPKTEPAKKEANPEDVVEVNGTTAETTEVTAKKKGVPGGMKGLEEEVLYEGAKTIHPPGVIQYLSGLGWTVKDIVRMNPETTEKVIDENIKPGSARVHKDGSLIVFHVQNPEGKQNQNKNPIVEKAKALKEGIDSGTVTHEEAAQIVKQDPNLGKHVKVTFVREPEEVPSGQTTVEQPAKVVTDAQGNPQAVQTPDPEAPTKVTNVVKQKKVQVTFSKEVGEEKPVSKAKQPHVEETVTKPNGPVLQWFHQKKVMKSGKTISDKVLRSFIGQVVHKELSMIGYRNPKYSMKDWMDDAISECFVKLLQRQPNEPIREAEWEKWLHTSIQFIAHDFVANARIPEEFAQTKRVKVHMARGKDFQKKLQETVFTLAARLQKDPKQITIAEIAKELEMTEDDLIQALDTMHTINVKFASKEKHEEEIGHNVQDKELKVERKGKEDDIAGEIAHEVSSDYTEPTDEELDAMAKVKKLPDLPVTADGNIEMPEMVKLVHDLTGHWPDIKRLVKMWGYHRFGNIVIDEQAFKNEKWAAYVLAHEIGHLLDWLPDQLLSERRGSLRMRLMVIREAFETAFGDLDFFLKDLYSKAGVKIDETTLKNELKALTQWWNPFDEKADEKHTKYRYSSKELYADFISMLFNQPRKIDEIAPNCSKLFWEHITKKPAVADAVLELMEFLELGENEKYRVRQGRLNEGYLSDMERFHKGRADAALSRKNFAFNFMRDFVDKNWALIEKLKQMKKAGIVIKPEDDPRYYTEERTLVGAKIWNLMHNIHKDCIAPLLAPTKGPDGKEIPGKSIEWIEQYMGSYMQAQWVVQGRQDVASPYPLTSPSIAQKHLDQMKITLGEDFKMVESAVQRFRQIVEDLLTKAQIAGYYSADQYKKMMTSTAYAPFQTLDHADEYVTSRMIPIKGTLKPSRNPFLVHTIKLMNLVRAIARQEERTAIIGALKMCPAAWGELAPAETSVATEKIKEFKEKPGRAIITVFENGVYTGYYVDPYIAEVTNNSESHLNHGAAWFLHLLNSRWFRPIFTSWNIGFQGMHAVRLLWRMWKTTPEASLWDILSSMRQAAPLAYQYAFKDMTPQMIYDMRQQGILGFKFSDMFKLMDKGEESQMDFLLRNYNLVKDKDLSGNPPGKMAFLKRAAYGVIDWFQDLGNFLETYSRLTAYIVRIKHQQKTGKSNKEIAHEVRWYGGSASLTARGRQHMWSNNVCLFFNDVVQGMRGDGRAGSQPKTRGAYWWRTVISNLMPCVLTSLATWGLFGPDLKRMYSRVSEYQLTGYHIIPIGETADNHTIALKIPQDIVGRILHGMLWKLMHLNKENILKSLSETAGVAAEAIPKPTPWLTIPFAWLQYVSGKVPYDFHEGKPILNQDDMRADIKYSIPKMVKHSLDQSGFWDLTNKKPTHNTLEGILSWTPLLSRFIIVTDAGLKKNETLDEYLRQRANVKEERAQARKTGTYL